MSYDMDDDEIEHYTMRPSRQGMKLKIIIAFILFMGIWGMFRLNTPWAMKGQLVVKNALNQEIAFQSVSSWYEHTFSGTPSFIPSLHPSEGEAAKKVTAPGVKSFFMPVFGKALIPYSPTHQAILLQTQANALVCAIETGRVVFAGIREDSGYTVVIQHAGGYQSTYGRLQPMQWKKDDWITLGEVVGKATTPKGQAKGNIVFALMKDAEYINPTDVISFD
ncbi:M23 family metallopeptidase [Paenibacillus psychroresistens]|uniref:M23 family metallopeptidase n=1 Tax=Paenibacillus psychroresistens TaxID=1778678 RepID=UPI001D04CA98|nr:M23 family metallopeptidase [Paenibacillus psychroresistens]